MVPGGSDHPSAHGCPWRRRAWPRTWPRKNDDGHGCAASSGWARRCAGQCSGWMGTPGGGCASAGTSTRSRPSAGTRSCPGSRGSGPRSWISARGRRLPPVSASPWRIPTPRRSSCGPSCGPSCGHGTRAWDGARTRHGSPSRNAPRSGTWNGSPAGDAPGWTAAGRRARTASRTRARVSRARDGPRTTARSSSGDGTWPRRHGADGCCGAGDGRRARNGAHGDGRRRRASQVSGLGR